MDYLTTTEMSQKLLTISDVIWAKGNPICIVLNSESIFIELHKRELYSIIVFPKQGLVFVVWVWVLSNQPATDQTSDTPVMLQSSNFNIFMSTLAGH